MSVYTNPVCAHTPVQKTERSPLHRVQLDCLWNKYSNQARIIYPES